MMQKFMIITNSPSDEIYLKRKDLSNVMKQLSSELLLHYDKARPLGFFSIYLRQSAWYHHNRNTFDQSLIGSSSMTIWKSQSSECRLQDLVTEVAQFACFQPLHINQEGQTVNGTRKSPQFTNEGIENHHCHVSHLVLVSSQVLYLARSPEYLEGTQP